MEDKELIILAHYVNVGNSSPQRAREILQSVLESINEENDPKYRFKNFVYPVKDESNARTECIFPVRQGPMGIPGTGIEDLETILQDINTKYENLLRKLDDNRY